MVVSLLLIAPLRLTCRSFYSFHSLLRLLIQDSSYKALAPKTRILLGAGLMLNAGVALQFSDQIEAALGLTPTSVEERKLQDSIPRVSAIDRNPK